MPPDAVIWLVGTLAVGAMAGVSTISVAMIRRSANGLATRRDFDELRAEMRAGLTDVRSDVKAVGVKLDTHITYAHPYQAG